jgi:hypothetical protein
VEFARISYFFLALVVVTNMNEKFNLVGSRYGRLSIIRRLDEAETENIGSKKSQRWWLAKCDCGKFKSFSSGDLNHNKIKSCGCLRGSNNPKTKPPGETAKKILYTQSQRWASDRGLSWSIGFDDFVSLSSGNCAYCGSEPSVRYGEGKYHGYFLKNGIDRLDSNKGYIYGNCVSCCRTCNSAKSIMSVDEFRAWICRVYSCFIEGKRNANSDS